MSDNMAAGFSIIIAHRLNESPRVTRPVLDRLGWSEAELIHVRGNLPSLQRNRAAETASRPFLYFLDDDSVPDPGNLGRIHAAFTGEKRVAVVGGPSLTSDSDSSLQRAFGHVLGSFWGSATVRARYRKTGVPRHTDDRELILCNLAFRRDVFLETGGFDTTLYPNEENELMDRIRERGHLLMHVPDVSVTRSQRPGFPAFIRQIFGYGRGRAEQLRRRFRISNLPLFIFAGMPLYFLLLPVLAVLAGPAAFLPAALHLVFDLLFALPLLFRDARSFPAAFPAFFLCHICYGCGMWRGLFGRLRSSRIAAPEAVCTVHPPDGGPRA